MPVIVSRKVCTGALKMFVQRHTGPDQWVTIAGFADAFTAITFVQAHAPEPLRILFIDGPYQTVPTDAEAEAIEGNAQTISGDGL